MKNIVKIVEDLETTLGIEIDKLPETLEQVSPEDKLNFIAKTLPVVIRYKEEHW